MPGGRFGHTGGDPEQKQLLGNVHQSGGDKYVLTSAVSVIIADFNIGRSRCRAAGPDQLFECKSSERVVYKRPTSAAR
jgi:hypothetical protein